MTIVGSYTVCLESEALIAQPVQLGGTRCFEVVEENILGAGSVEEVWRPREQSKPK